MKAVITGATGYIGSNLMKLLLNSGWDVAIIAQPAFGYDNIKEQKEKIKILEYHGEMQELIDFFVEFKPEVVFHLAAAIILDHKPEQIATLIQSNIQFGTEVLEAMKQSSTRLFINTGTYWQNYNSDQYNPVDLYAATKEAFEKIIQLYVDAYDFRVITLRLFDVYGENDKRPKLINQIINNAEKKEIIDVSPGEQKLDMVHISDVCMAYISAHEWLVKNNGLKNEVFGVYTGETYSLKHLIGIMQKSIGKPLNVNIGGKPYKKRELMKPFSKLKKLPNWDAKICIEDGIDRMNNK